jgi:uncharacterized protein (TIGR02996 family)
MPRYEYCEGKSNKFWEIELSGSSFTTRYGRIGSEGKQAVKRYGNAAEAKAAYEKLIAQKVAKGYVSEEQARAQRRPAPAPAGPVAVARDNALEQALLEEPSEVEHYLVYADWLQTQGDPRGELIAVQHELSESGGRDRGLARREEQLLEQHAAQLLPSWLPAELARWTTRKIESWETGHCELSWHLGFLKRARLARFVEDEVETPLETMVAELLAHPSAMLLEELVVGRLGVFDEYAYQPVADAIAKARPVNLRRLDFADFHSEDTELSWSDLGDLSKMLRALPRLEQLKLRGGGMALGTLDLPHLRSFGVETGGLSSAATRAISSARWPQLERLHVYFGSDNYGAEASIDDIVPILAARGLAKLRHLGLMNAEFSDEIAEQLGRSKVLRQLETLDLSLGTLGERGARAILAQRDRFAHLKQLDLADNFIPDDLCAELSRVCGSVSIGDQEEPDEWDGEEHRYVSVGE